MNNFQFFFFPLFLGLLFFCIGAAMIVRPNRFVAHEAQIQPRRPPPTNVEVRFIGVIIFAFGLLALWVSLRGPWPSERSRYISRLMNLSPGDVNAIVVKRFVYKKRSPGEYDMGYNTITVTEVNSIEEMCSALQHAQEPFYTYERGAAAIWAAHMSIVTRQDTVELEVNNMGRYGLFIKSSVGELRCDELRPVLENLPSWNDLFKEYGGTR